MNITAADRDFSRKSTAISGGSIEQAAFSTRQNSPADNSRRMQIDLIPTEKPSGDQKISLRYAAFRAANPNQRGLFI